MRKFVCGCWYHQELYTFFTLWYPSRERWLWRLCLVVGIPLSVEVIEFVGIPLVRGWSCVGFVPSLVCRGCWCLREELCTPKLYYPNPKWRSLCGKSLLYHLGPSPMKNTSHAKLNWHFWRNRTPPCLRPTENWCAIFFDRYGTSTWKCIFWNQCKSVCANVPSILPL